MTFQKLAEEILKLSDEPLTANEIWQKATEIGLDSDLESKGKTPWATLGARLYVIVAYYHLSCYTKTINHSKSGKKEFGEWVHPDMVGCIFPIDDWDNEVLQLSSVVGNTSIKFISFEIKKELNLSTLREKFFQTVSNSSWANESYLVASEISNNSDFLSELSRLSASFGIGLIRLEIEDPNSSEIILQPKTREYLDWETINKLTMNTDFKEFLNYQYQEKMKKLNWQFWS
jgi:hypothetical protein